VAEGGANERKIHGATFAARGTSSHAPSSRQAMGHTSRTWHNPHEVAFYTCHLVNGVTTI
jgi:hypothetical protein